MTNKEKIEALNYIWFYEPTCQEDADKRDAIIKELKKDLEDYEELKKLMGTPIQDIMKRLEILDMLKQEFHIKLYSAEEISYHSYLITIQSCEDYEYGCFDTTAETQITKEQYDKLKEWLDNEK